MYLELPEQRINVGVAQQATNAIDGENVLGSGKTQGNPKDERMSILGNIKDSSTHARKWFKSVIRSSGSTARNSHTSSTYDEDYMEYLDFDMKEELEKDLDLLELIHHQPWKPEDRAKYDDDAVYWYANQHPKSFRVRYDFDKQNRGKISNFPLLRIVSLGASLRTVEAVVRAYPPALVKRHHQHRTSALHSACSYPSLFQVGVIQFLLEHNPGAVSQTNCHAFLPIHNACSAGLPSPIGLEAIQILVEAYPESIVQSNKLGDTPLQAARRNTKSLPDVICYLEEIQKQHQEHQG